MSLVAAAAQAQAPSGVMMYGLIDATAGRFQGAATGVNAQDRTVYRVDGGGMSTSHFGLRGNEDLGGGLTASFEIAAFMRNDTGAAGRGDAIGAPVNVAADPFWSRAAWVGLGSASVGRVRIGNATTLLFLDAITGNAFGDSTVFGPLNLVTFIGSPLSGGTGWTNSVVWDSPAFGGFSGNLARSLAENQGGHNTAVRARYAQGPLTTSFAVQDVKKNPLTFADGTSANNTRSWLLGGSWNVSGTKLFAHVGGIVNKGTETAPANVGYRIWDLSAAIPLGPGQLLAGYASRTTGDTPAPVPATAAGGNVERRVLTVGYDWYLSLRTDIYAMAMSDRTRTRTLPAPPTVVDASGTSLGVGFRHRF